MGPNPYAKVIHMARAVDAWRIFPKTVPNSLYLITLQVRNLVHELSRSYNGTIRFSFSGCWCRCGMVWSHTIGTDKSENKNPQVLVWTITTY